MITDLKINEERKQYYYDMGYWTRDTMRDIWHARVAEHAQDEYVSDDQGARFTYGQVDDLAGRLASWLIEQGVEPGDVISFQMPTWAEFCIAYVACLKVGGVMHPLPRTYNDEDLLYAMNQVSTVAFICPTFFHKCSYEKQALEIKDRIPSLKAIAVLEKGTPSETDLPTVEDICRRYEPLAEFPEVSSDDVVCILTTSGTTGKPKAALFTHNTLLFSERTFIKGAERTKDDVMFMASPLNHATGFFHGLISPMLLGGRSVLQQDFNPAAAIDLINAEGATWTMGATPFVYDTLASCKERGIRPESLELFLSGGAPLPGSMVQRAHECGFLLCEVYGSTESCPHALVPPEKCLEWNGAWSGIPCEGVEIRVVDGEGKDVDYGVQGEEISRGPHMFVGYLNDKERTDRALDDDGWFFSGDLCYADEQGRIRINGRKKEIIIRGGENICAREIDDNLAGCPGVGGHATIGMPDDRMGERICTFVVPCDGITPTLESVKEYLKSKHVAKRLWPERIELIDEIPLTATGKVKRFKLADELAKRMKAEQA